MCLSVPQIPHCEIRRSAVFSVVFGKGNSLIRSAPGSSITAALTDLLPLKDRIHFCQQNCYHNTHFCAWVKLLLSLLPDIACPRERPHAPFQIHFATREIYEGWYAKFIKDDFLESELMLKSNVLVS